MNIEDTRKLSPAAAGKVILQTAVALADPPALHDSLKNFSDAMKTTEDRDWFNQAMETIAHEPTWVEVTSVLIAWQRLNTTDDREVEPWRADFARMHDQPELILADGRVIKKTEVTPATWDGWCAALAMWGKQGL